MSRIMKTLLLTLLMLSCLLLTGCYTDNDPWVPADGLESPQVTDAPVVTMVPATDVPATAIPLTPQSATEEPLPEDAVDVSPNFNG